MWQNIIYTDNIAENVKHKLAPPPLNHFRKCSVIILHDKIRIGCDIGLKFCFREVMQEAGTDLGI